MRAYSMVEFMRNVRDVTLAAAQSPVTLTQHRKARYVLMSIGDFERLTASAEDTRKAYRVEDMPSESRALFLDALQPSAPVDAD
jgi:PHD/YefM family antitoxin component YafN of YafNO toxin-antitoxin module